MADYYVSPSGSDTANGSVASPFLTVRKGLNTVAPGDRVIVREGIYRGAVGWFPGNATLANPISIEAFPRESVTFSALTQLTGWQAFDLTGGKAIYRTLMPFTMCAGNVITGEDFLLWNGKVLNEAQWPPANTNKYPQPSNEWATVDSGQWTSDSSVEKAPVTGQIQDSDLVGFPAGSLVGSKITILPGARWTLLSGTVTTNSGVTLTFIAKSPGADSFYRPDNRSLYFLFNKQIYLSYPGSWWRDPASEYVYVWLPDSSNPANSIIEAKSVDKIFDFWSRSFYRFKGVNFIGATAHTPNVSGFNFTDCKFTHYTHRLYFDTTWSYFKPGISVTGNDFSIKDCDFVDSIGPAVTAENNSNLTIQNCVVTNCMGVDFAGQNSKFVQNTVLTTPGPCVRMYRNCTNSQFSNNNLGSSGNMYTDEGVFLISTGCIGGNSQVFQNYIHDGMGAANGLNEWYGSSGIYFDPETSNITFHHNIVTATTSPNISLVAQGNAITNMNFYSNVLASESGVYWVPAAYGGSLPGCKFINNFIYRRANNTQWHSDILFSKNAFQVTPGEGLPPDNISTPDPKFLTDYFLAGDSYLKYAGQTILGITTTYPPDIGAREGIPWNPGAIVRQIDVTALTVATYSVDGDRIVFALENLPFGRRLGENFKMKLGSGIEATGTNVAYSTTIGRTVWARVASESWVAIGQINTPPILNSLSSGAGLVGSVVSIQGSGFQSSSAILVGGTVLPTTYISATRLDLVIPLNTNPGTLPFKVVNGDGQRSGTLDFSVLSLLSLTSLSVGVAGPGQQIQVQGIGFVAGAIARFNSTEVSTNFSSSTTLGVQIPVLPAGTVSVRIVNPNGVESEARQLTIVILPLIASYTPNPIQPGQELAIVGEHFGVDPYVLIAGTEVIPIAYTETSLVAIVPSSTFAGTPQVRVVSGVGQSAPVSLTVIRPPVLSAVIPVSAPIGTRVVLTGSDLIMGSQIFFNDTPGIVPSFTGTTATVTVPPLSVGTVTLKVVSPQGITSSTISFGVLPSPGILSIFPEAAVVGDTITIVGENFLSGIQVFLSDLEVTTGVTILSVAQLSVVVPNRSPGAYEIWVLNPDGGISDEVDFLIQGRPTISTTSVTKALPGGVISITGINFEPGAVVQLGNSVVLAQLIGSSSLSFVVPTVSPGIVDLAVRNITTLQSTPIAFEILAVPVITSVSPTQAIAQEEISVIGLHFKPDVKLFLGNYEVICIRESATSLKLIVPSQLFGTFALKAANVTDNLISLSVNFTVLRKPVITSIVPASAQPGSTIKIFGTDFENPIVLLNGSSIGFASINGGLSLVLPEFPPSILPIRIRNGSNVLSEPVTLTVLPPITLGFATPTTSAPKTIVELQGSFFPVDALVFFGNVEAEVISVTGDRLVVKIPNLPALPTSIQVRTPAGAISGSSIAFDVLPTLAIFEVTPNPAPPGTEVEVKGSGFDVGTLVFVRDVLAINQIRISDNLIKFTVPTLVPGVATIRLALLDDLQVTFAFAVPSVWISEISHTVAQVGEWLEITGTGFVRPLNVTIGGVVATEVIVVSQTLIRAKVPAFLINAVD